jgi:Viral coat protein P2 N-terminal domain
MNKIIPLNPFNNVVASGIAICDLNNLLGSTLEAINLTLSGTTFSKSMITLIQLKANGKVIWESDGSKLDASELFKGNPADANRLCIDFMERNARTINAFQSGAIDLSPQSGIVSLRMEVTTSGATSPALTGLAELSPAVAVPGEEAIRFLIQRRHRVSYTVPAANSKVALPIPHIDPSGGGSVYKRIYIYSSSMNAVQIVRNGLVEFDSSTLDINQIQRRAKRAPQSNLFVFDAMLDNVQSGRVWDTRPASGVTQAMFLATFSNTETITIETEEIIPLSMY